MVALKDLGFTLDQVATIVDDEIDVDELRGMLRLRRAELREQIAADTARLARVEARLRVIEREDVMSEEIEIKTVPAVRVAELSAPVGGFEPQFITPVLGPLFDRLMSRLGEAGVACVGAPIAYYEDAGDGEGLIVHAAAPIAEDAEPTGLLVTELPEISAAAIIHRGPMDDVMPTIQTLGGWIAAHGYRSAGLQPRGLPRVRRGHARAVADRAPGAGDHRRLTGHDSAGAAAPAESVVTGYPPSRRVRVAAARRTSATS